MTLRVQPVNPGILTTNFFGFGHALTKLAEKLSSALSPIAAPWNTLPREVLTEIINFAGEPERTAQVCRLWHSISTSEHFYPALLQRYQTYPSLTCYLPDPTLCTTQPKKAVGHTLMGILDTSGELKVDWRKIQILSKKTDVLSPIFLEQVLELNEAKIAEQCAIKRKVTDLWLFCESLYLKHIPIPEMDEDKLLEHFESYIDAAEDLYRTKKSLDLLEFNMSYLTPKIGRLTALTDLCLRGNKFKELPLELKKCRSLESLDIGRNSELSVENVREVCRSFPLLKYIYIEHNNTKMLTMFETHFPRVSICRLEFASTESGQS
jgi:hypothetical protein